MPRRISIALTVMMLCASLLVFSQSNSVQAEVTEPAAILTIAAAQDRLVWCYQAVADASSAGADVSGLIPVLDQSAGNLSMAYVAYDNGNFSSAQAYANQTLNLLNQNGIDVQAGALRAQAAQVQFWGFMLNVVVPLVGALVAVIAGFAVWTVLKKRYATEVGSDGA